ncbi:hypothetical protein; putative signal peptide [Frankia alni ACN14a]|uniref:Uncharacterized protein n=1 Tax=Frankia alni (strain DSM 45986 / CECT 9034 / ACN14a) TaxID=326424 RepID=Q0RIE7_FRAAA|nr:hypothetical protein; putative signal peptide [Frankia alni ACN14a]
MRRASWRGATTPSGIPLVPGSVGPGAGSATVARGDAFIVLYFCSLDTRFGRLGGRAWRGPAVPAMAGGWMRSRPRGVYHTVVSTTGRGRG